MAYKPDRIWEVNPIVDNANPGVYYVSGFYDLVAAKATLTIGGTVVLTNGTASNMKGARALAVVSGASAGATVLTVTGVSITDAGAKNDSDSEVLIANCSLVSASQYFQTSKRWLGQVTYTLSGGGAGNALSFNYGFVRAKNLENSNYYLNSILYFGLGATTDAGLDCEILHHKAAGWAYSAGAFVSPAANVICSAKGDCGTNVRVAAGIYVNWRRTGLTNYVQGATLGEGIIIRVTFASSSTLKWGYVRFGATKLAIA